MIGWVRAGMSAKKLTPCSFVWELMPMSASVSHWGTFSEHAGNALTSCRLCVACSHIKIQCINWCKNKCSLPKVAQIKAERTTYLLFFFPLPPRFHGLLWILTKYASFTSFSKIKILVLVFVGSFWTEFWDQVKNTKFLHSSMLHLRP